VTVLAVLTGAVAAAWWLRQGAIIDQKVRLDDVAAVLAQHAGRTVESVDLALTVLADRIAIAPPIDGTDAEELRQLLHDHIVGLPHIRSAIFLDANGIGRGDSEAAPPRPINVGDRPYFQEHRNQAGRGLYVGAPVWSRISNQWTIIFSRRVQAADGSFLGVVAAGVDPGVFSEFYRKLAIGSSSRMSLVRSDGLLMARHPLSTRGLGDPVDPTEATGDAVVSATGAVERYPISVVITMPMAAALLGWEHQVAVIGGATVMALIFIAFIGYLLFDQSDRLETMVGELASTRDEAVRARMREEEASRAKTAFLANTSHELRTPLNAILGFSEVLRDGHVGALDPSHRGYAASIHDAGTHLLGLISDLLDMAKIEARELHLRETIVDLADIIADSLKLTERRAAERGVTVISRVEGDAIRVRGDAQRFRQIVLNLLTNSIKFTAAGGRVWIDASIDPNSRPTLVVSDTGIGMTPEEIKVALTPFRQVESAIAREQEGTGLGLPIVKALVELHGGTLRIESERGIGTKVTASFPVSRAVFGISRDVRVTTL
jgi:signal transduction histidine kinase